MKYGGNRILYRMKLYNVVECPLLSNLCYVMKYYYNLTLTYSPTLSSDYPIMHWQLSFSKESGPSHPKDRLPDIKWLKKIFFGAETTEIFKFTMFTEILIFNFFVQMHYENAMKKTKFEGSQKVHLPFCGTVRITLLFRHPPNLCLVAHYHFSLELKYSPHCLPTISNCFANFIFIKKGP